ncbi:hypothetical protein G5B30_09870 [Sphingobacterium sp. SGG-5]|uniref:HmuY family protein n=1 Tax=Sphingobacterium sp. SGG-5 TaxID=2710881 RepID=UPI0013EB34D6|nr:HmuY family protein [Sphingobacterium sp. SGG-5]NGM62221.1 hypothetical protein [Sphingobacterium sp. SGG-5]
MKTIKLIINELGAWLVCGRTSYLCISCLLLTLSSCGKDEDPRPQLEDGKSTVVHDLAGDIEAAMGEGVDGKEDRDFYTFLFRFRDKRQIWIKTKQDSLQWLKTNEWDIAFTGPYNSEIYINNANYPANPGYEGEAANTAVIKVDQSYEAVAIAPDDNAFDQSTVTKIGWAPSTSSNGWFQYSLETHIMLAIPNRTYVIRLPDGKYAKLQLINAYKGNPTAVTNMNWPAPYYTFRYYVQQDGSKDLNTK